MSLAKVFKVEES